MSTLHSLRCVLLSLSVAANANQTGHVMMLVPSTDASQTFRLHTVLTQSETGVSDSNNPITVSTVIEHSPDNVNWMEMVPGVTTNANGSLSQFLAIASLMKYVRVKTVLTGAMKPFHTVQISLLSNRRFEYKDMTAGSKLTPAF